jgi:hypothetical protein
MVIAAVTTYEGEVAYTGTEYALTGDGTYEEVSGGRRMEEENPGIPPTGMTFAPGDYGTARLSAKAGNLVWELLPLNVAGATGPAGGTITVKAVDGSPSISSVAELRFDETDGFDLSTPGAGIARVDILAATTTQAGIVSTAQQNFAGTKSFRSITVGTTQYGDPNTIADGVIYATNDIITETDILAVNDIESWTSVAAISSVDANINGTLHLVGPQLFPPDASKVYTAADSTTVPSSTASGNVQLYLAQSSTVAVSILPFANADGGSCADVWCVPTRTGVGQTEGRWIVCGRYAYWDADDGNVYTGISGTRIVKDSAGTDKTVTIKGGLIVAWET